MVVVSLARYDAACAALADAKAIDEVKNIRNEAEAMRAYARQAKNRTLELDAAEIRIRAERRVGELIAAQKSSVGLAPAGRKKIGSTPDPITAPATLAEAGIDKHLADRARKLAALPPEKFERVVEHWRERSEADSGRVSVDVLAPLAHVSQNTGDNEWFTPREFIEPARKVLGGIDLDPASSAAANTVVKATTFYTKSDDGLTKTWKGRVWMNPPYAQPLIGLFADKLANAYQSKSVQSAIVLVNNATETAWFRVLAEHASAICFPHGRVRFWAADKSTAAPLQGQALLYLGPSTATFHARFSDIGTVWVKP